MPVIKQYKVEVWGATSANSERATILLIGDGGQRSALGRIHFYDPGTRLPPDTSRDDIVDMHVPLESFAGVLALLQHDSPVQIVFEDRRGRLRTGEWEAVGETERR